MSTLRALRQLCGTYGNVMPGQVFTTDEATAEQLLNRGFVERHYDSGPITTAGLLAKMFAAPENKMIQPEANKSDGWEFLPTGNQTSKPNGQKGRRR